MFYWFMWLPASISICFNSYLQKAIFWFTNYLKLQCLQLLQHFYSKIPAPIFLFMTCCKSKYCYSEALREKCRYSEFFWSKCGKIRTRKTPKREIFHALKIIQLHIAQVQKAHPIIKFHFVKYRNFTKFSGVEILWKRAISA